MLVSNLVISNYPSVTPQDKVSFALSLMSDYDIHHLAVVTEDQFTGVIAKDDLLDADENAILVSLSPNILKLSVDTRDHFTTALKIAVEHQLSLVPVVAENNELAGVISSSELLKSLYHFTGTDEPGAIIVLEIEKRDYSFGEISRLVETNDAYIMQLNSSVDPDTGLMIVTVKINKYEVSDIIGTFQRYDYTVKYYFGEEWYVNQLKDNYDLLMNYLKM
ncbi:MAG: hypothetical protein JWN76_2658 [Chitinophagaceae bacterium]|nr:hypothetical protein [Chitinophagaceae bacterium]